MPALPTQRRKGPVAGEIRQGVLRLVQRGLDSAAARTRKGRKTMGGELPPGFERDPEMKALRRKPKEVGQCGLAEAFA